MKEKKAKKSIRQEKKPELEDELMKLTRGKRVPEHLLDLFVLKSNFDDTADEFCQERTIVGPQAKVWHCSRKKGKHRVHVALHAHNGPLVCNPWK